RAIDELSRLPGVQSASAINVLPFDGFPSGTRIEIGGHPKPATGEEPTSRIRTVMPGYFQTMRIPIQRGRDFTAGDNIPQTPYRFVVNETFVRRYLAAEE